MNTLPRAIYSKAPQQGYAPLNVQALEDQNRRFIGTGGVSKENRGLGFIPAFHDKETGSVYLSRFADGRPAPMHLLDGLPDDVVVSRSASGAVRGVKSTVIVVCSANITGRTVAGGCRNQVSRAWRERCMLDA